MRPLPAHAFLFPLAALYAAVAVPLSLPALTGGSTLVPGIAGPAGHAHELLFGFAAAVAAGYLINRASRIYLAALIGSWSVARVAFLFFPGGWIASLAGAAFFALAAYATIPPFVRTAKKWRNRAVAVILSALFGAGAAYALSGLWAWEQGQRAVLALGVDAVTALMLFMGGRIIAPAVGGHMERCGVSQEARVQPAIEGALLVAMATAVVAGQISGAEPLRTTALAVAGGLAGVRLARWRLWRCPDRPDLICLGVGYGWLAVGLLLQAAVAVGVAPFSMTAATHAVLVGALGTLTITVMTRVRRLRVRDRVSGFALPATAVAVIAIAAVARIAADGVPTWRTELLAVATAGWASAYALLLVALFLPAAGGGERRR